MRQRNCCYSEISDVCYAQLGWYYHNINRLRRASRENIILNKALVFPVITRLGGPTTVYLS